MQFDCGGGEDRECSDWLGIISIIVYNKFSSGARVVTLVKKMIQSSYWNFSIQLIIDDLLLFLPDAFLTNSFA